jgi:hypothetical protein
MRNDSRDAVELRPGFAQVGEQRVDRFIAADITFKDQVRTEFLGEFVDAVFEALTHVGEGQVGAFPFACGGNAIGNRAIGQ